jgi:hypothetical protein
VKVIVAGSRSIDDAELVSNAMFDFEYYVGTIDEVVCGMAAGADMHGRNRAMARGIPVKEFPANWDSFGKSAGPRRNREMAEYADGLVAVWDGKSSGTIDMVTYMMKARKPVILITRWIGDETTESDS